jgi:hypothetical protein
MYLCSFYFYWCQISSHYDLIRNYSNFLYLLRILLWPNIYRPHDTFWGKSHGLLRKMYILLMLGGTFCRYLLHLFDSLCSLTLSYLCWWTIDQNAVLKSSLIIVFGSICPFIFSNTYFMKLDTLTFGASKFRIVLSSWCIAPIINI